MGNITGDHFETPKDVNFQFLSQDGDSTNNVHEAEAVKSCISTGYNEDGYKIFGCLLCERRFPDHALIKRHIESVHVTGVLVSCDTCNKMFKNEHSLREHYRCFHVDTWEEALQWEHTELTVQVVSDSPTAAAVPSNLPSPPPLSSQMKMREKPFGKPRKCPMCPI